MKKKKHLKVIQKIVLILFLVGGILLNLSAQTTLFGKVTEEDSGTPVLFGNVILYQNKNLITGTETDLDGLYKFENIEPGIYDLEFSYVGFSTRRISGVVVYRGKPNEVNAKMSAGVSLDCVVVKGFSVPLLQKDNTTQSRTLTPAQMNKMPTRNIKALAANAAGLSSVDQGDNVVVKGSRSNNTTFFVDGIRYYGEIPKAKNWNPFKRKKLSHAIIEEDIFRAGQLTASEWRDLDHWKTWNELIEEDFASFSNHWSIYPKNRYSFFVSSQQGVPLTDISITLISNDGSVLWSSRTDNQGKAELWLNPYTKENELCELNLVVDNQLQDVEQLNHFAKGINNIQLNRECNAQQVVDLQMVMDVTGSMADELDYLRSEVQDVIKSVEDQNENVVFRFGTVFYRGINDNEVVKHHPFTEYTQRAIDFVKNERAGGGGIEAVTLALEKAINDFKWSEAAISRMLFLILDEPPHDTPEKLSRLHEVIRQASLKGIKIIPITASGINRDLEFLMKAIANLTNGTYVYLTNHSGIGHDHLEPTNDAQPVEKLNALLKRLINENVKLPECKESLVEDLFARPTEKSRLVSSSVYPNPAADFIHVSLSAAADKMIVTDLNGKQVQSFESLHAGTNQLNISDLESGMYNLNFWSGKTVFSERFIKIKPE